jgi:signal transduction histidine kinase
MRKQGRPDGTTIGAAFAGRRRPSGRRGLRAFVRDAFTSPFRVDPEAVATASGVSRDQERRAALLRLILTITILIFLLLAIPLAILRHQTTVVPVLGLVAASAVVSLLLTVRGHAQIGAFLFIATSAALTLGYALGRPDPLNPALVATLATLCLFILLGGLLLPGRAVGLLTVLMMIITAVVFLRPPLETSGQALGARIGVLSQLASIELLTGIVAWVAARLSRASVDATSQALERERELTALKDQFIIYANHELRTPVMTLYNNLEVLEMLGEGGEGGDSTTHERALRRALTSGDVVLGLLHSVLDVSALEASQPRIEAQAVALAPLVRAILETFDPREVGEPGLEEDAYQARAAQVEIPAELVVWADEGRVRQVLVNLVANALKYSDPGTPITISADILDEQRGHRSRRTVTAGPHSQRASAAGMVRVSVRDMGLGVPPRDASKLFNRFVRLERDIAGPVRGTGVGLYLCRVLVEAMGGRIWVESTGVPGEGSTFSFTLPVPVPERVA